MLTFPYFIFLSMALSLAEMVRAIFLSFPPHCFNAAAAAGAASAAVQVQNEGRAEGVDYAEAD